MQKCRQKDSVLVDVSSNEENVYLQHGHNGAKSWLGLNDRTIESNFTWVDRGQANLKKKKKNQPNDFRGEDCVHALGVEYSYEWNDVKCSDCHPYTCKKGKTWIVGNSWAKVVNSSKCLSFRFKDVVVDIQMSLNVVMFCALLEGRLEIIANLIIGHKMTRTFI